MNDDLLVGALSGEDSFPFNNILSPGP